MNATSNYGWDSFQDAPATSSSQENPSHSHDAASGCLALTAKKEVVRARAPKRLRSRLSIPLPRPGHIRLATILAVRLRRRKLATALVSVIFLISCATDETAGTLTLADGSKLTDLLTEESCGAVLVMSPRECLSCSGILETWVERGRALRFELHLLMTESPSAKQVEALSLRRIPLRGVVSDAHTIPEPRAYFFTDGVVTDSVVGVAEQTLFLSGLMSIERGDDDQSDCWKTIEVEGGTG